MALSRMSPGTRGALVRALAGSGRGVAGTLVAHEGGAMASRVRTMTALRGPRMTAVCSAARPQSRSLWTSPRLLATQQFKLADIGEGIAEVQLTEWFVKEGDMVKEMDNLCAVESDKASVELTSPYTGKVTKVYHKVQDTVKVGSVLIDIEVAGGGAAPAAPAKPAASAPPAAPATAAPAAGGGIKEFKLADIGEGIAEVQLTEWFVKEGDMVKEMDNLCAVESDKASVELTSPYTGKVKKIHYKVQDTVKVGSLLVEIEVSGGGGAAPATPAKPAASAPTTAPAAGGGIKEFKLADIGEGIAEVVVTDLFVKVGDMVKEMDNICAVESDKASVELTSPFTGKVVKINCNVQDTIKVGATLVEIETSGGGPAPSSPSVAATPAAASTPAAATPAAKAPSAPATTQAKPGTSAPGVLATPKVRFFAREKGVDLNKISGSGPMGRVLEEDVLAALKSATEVKPAASAAPASAPATSPAPAPTFQRPPVRPGEESVVQITDMIGKGMVKSMAASLSTPYMALGEEIDITEMVKLQKAFKEYTEKKYGTKVALTSFFIKAISLAINEWPKINTKFGPADANPPQYTMYGSHNISVAIDSPHGLVVPNIKDVGNLSVIEIQQELVRLAKLAKDNKLGIGDITGGTITFSNVGVIGTKDPRPILFDGQAVIGAAGRTMTLPRYNAKGDLVPRQIMNVRWVGDHRHLDGATLARFSNAFRRYVEDPAEWTLTLR